MNLIDQKLNINNFINAMNELEKLKMLLFDENQYFLFEHIPKPILCDEELIELNQKDKVEKKLDKESIKKQMSIKGRKNKVETILTYNAHLWQRRSNRQKEKNFQIALQRLKDKVDEEGNVIDQRLIDILENFNYNNHNNSLI